MLTVNPDKRITIDKIVMHPWFVNSAFGNTEPPILQDILIDFNLIKLLKEKYNLDENEVLSSVKDNKHN